MYNCKLLQWTKHFDEKCKKVSSVKPTLRKAELYVLQKILLTMYYTYNSFVLIIADSLFGTTVQKKN
jgi:hypothetical protein